MRVLITGGAGFIGTHVARALLERGDDVVILDALTQPVHAPGRDPAIPEGARFVAGDVRDADAWRGALTGVEAVVHLAAYQDYGTDFSRFMEVNAAGTALLYELMAAERFPIRRVVYASSESVYGEGLVRCSQHGVVPAAQRRAEDLARGEWDARCTRCGEPSPPEPMREDVAQPHNAYGIAKLAGEHAALVLGRQHDVPTAALRYAIVHGPGQSPRNAYSGLLRSACLAWLGGRAPVVFEDGEQLRDYVAIDDAVSATLLALDHPEAPGAAYNVGGARSLTVNHVLDALHEIVGADRPAPQRRGTWRLGDVRHTVGDTSALRALGWQPAEDLAPTWRAYWAWLQDQDPATGVVDDAFEDMSHAGILRQSDM